MVLCLLTIHWKESLLLIAFSSLNASTHERDYYTCVATLSISDVPTTKTASTTYNLVTLSMYAIRSISIKLILLLSLF